MGLSKKTLKIGTIIAAGVAGAILLPILWGIVTGALASLFEAAGSAAPEFMRLGLVNRFTPYVGFAGFVIGAWWGVNRV